VGNSIPVDFSDSEKRCDCWTARIIELLLLRIWRYESVSEWIPEYRNALYRRERSMQKYFWLDRSKSSHKKHWTSQRRLSGCKSEKTLPKTPPSSVPINVLASHRKAKAQRRLDAQGAVPNLLSSERWYNWHMQSGQMAIWFRVENPKSQDLSSRVL